MPLLLVMALTAFFVSLGGRLLAESFLTAPIPLVGTFAGFTVTENPGVAFGILLPHILQRVLVACALFFILVLAWTSRRHTAHAAAFGLILGGALANIVDRLDDGLVTDFIRIGAFPTFNIADSCITVGVIALFLLSLSTTMVSPHVSP